MPTYKNISNDDLNLLYLAVKNHIDTATGTDTPLSVIQELVDEYVQDRINTDDLLADIDNELEWIPTFQDDMDDALAAIPNLNIPNGVKLILTAQSQGLKRLSQENYRQLKAWRFMIKNLSDG